MTTLSYMLIVSDFALASLFSLSACVLDLREHHEYLTTGTHTTKYTAVCVSVMDRGKDCAKPGHVIYVIVA